MASRAVLFLDGTGLAGLTGARRNSRGDVAGQAFGIVERRLARRGVVRVVAKGALAAPVVGAPAAALHQAVGGRKHRLHAFAHTASRFLEVMARAAKFRLLRGVKPRRVENLSVLELAGVHGGNVAGSRPVARFAGNSRRQTLGRKRSAGALGRAMTLQAGRRSPGRR